MKHPHALDVLPRIVREGAAYVDGAKFRWAYDSAGVLEVWNWRYGRSCRCAGSAATDILIRRTAMDLIERHTERLDALQPHPLVKSTDGTWSDLKSLRR